MHESHFCAKTNTFWAGCGGHILAFHGQTVYCAPVLDLLLS